MMAEPNMMAQPTPQQNQNYGTAAAMAQLWGTEQPQLWHNQHCAITNTTAQPWPWHNYGVRHSHGYGITNTMP